ncbi:hypothetical protein Sden_0903 [Shewanella denitrificans OS217]|jgi:hypothetical protein|uniref:Lipoprotein n=1 Tax=Shewanella denitrificans (strain OS217 / ATCC BAA-1090 / DSM 15013) TaxID=318161 RepID=Q12QT5_SHEDO|nr:hypothetical protein [Shewanella denitrificans]ABE54191.1 hypothetical protein Sden_0903 [Shewanella denitrificans OS217]
MKAFTVVVLIIMMLFLSACQLNKRVKSHTSIAQAEQMFNQRVPIAVTNLALFNNAYEHKKGSSGVLGIFPDTATLVNFDTYLSPAKVVILPHNTKNIIIQSYVSSASNGAMFLFYPLITAFDNDKRQLAQIKPRYEFEFDKNVLSNQFVLPEKTRYILIHTTPEFTGMSFTESNANYKVSLLNSEAIMVASAVVTGIPLASTAGPTTYLPEYADFNLAIIGNIKLIIP